MLCQRFPGWPNVVFWQMSVQVFRESQTVLGIATRTLGGGKAAHEGCIAFPARHLCGLPRQTAKMSCIDKQKKRTYYFNGGGETDDTGWTPIQCPPNSHFPTS